MRTPPEKYNITIKVEPCDGDGEVDLEGVKGDASLVATFDGVLRSNIMGPNYPSVITTIVKELERALGIEAES